MSEIPNVIPGEPVESVWGNGVRDRCAQRYVDQVALDISVPVPVVGDVAYLTAEGILQYYDGSNWIPYARLDGAAFYGSVDLINPAQITAQDLSGINGVGLRRNQGLSLELGRTDGAAGDVTPFVDLHDGSDTDYSARMVLEGDGGGVVGAAGVKFLADGANSFTGDLGAKIISPTEHLAGRVRKWTNAAGSLVTIPDPGSPPAVLMTITPTDGGQMFGKGWASFELVAAPANLRIRLAISQSTGSAIDQWDVSPGFTDGYFEMHAMRRLTGAPTAPWYVTAERIAGFGGTTVRSRVASIEVEQVTANGI